MHRTRLAHVIALMGERYCRSTLPIKYVLGHTGRSGKMNALQMCVPMDVSDHQLIYVSYGGLTGNMAVSRLCETVPRTAHHMHLFPNYIHRIGNITTQTSNRNIHNYVIYSNIVIHFHWSI
jgi:hypothetical protein